MVGASEFANVVEVDKEEEESNESQSCNFCTFAVTGASTSFQPIFVCHECFDENSADEAVPLCICQSCADTCHNGDDHDVEYIGMGPCYCDCDNVGKCCIFQKSLIEADRLGIATSERVHVLNEGDSCEEEASQPINPTRYIQDVYEIKSLQDLFTTDLLIQHAQELIKHSKETHWVDNQCANTTSLCALEQLAWRIYERHVGHYELLKSETDGGGAEFWVQVKEIGSGKESAIDLHYDKDEALADSFGLGSFPTLSTVTYLTDAKKVASPTVVFDHTYSQGEDDLMNTMLVSRPRHGKHLVFDGTLLHGAPSHPLLKPVVEAVRENNIDGTKGKESTNSEENQEERSFRVTFLVNIWKRRRPANVKVLEETVRQKLELLARPSWLESPLDMTKQAISSWELNKEEDLPLPLQNRIELPFVTKGVTWEDELNIGEEDGGGSVIITFPPPPTDDTLLVTFGAGLQAYLDFPQKQNDSHTTRIESELEHESGYC